MDRIASLIAEAVAQQNAATQEIARNVQQAASGTGLVSDSTARVSDAARASGDAAGDVLAVAKDMTRQAEALRVVVGRFVARIRAA